MRVLTAGLSGMKDFSPACRLLKDRLERRDLPESELVRYSESLPTGRAIGRLPQKAPPQITEKAKVKY
jgi:hypothetical protein